MNQNSNDAFEVLRQKANESLRMSFVSSAADVSQLPVSAHPGARPEDCPEVCIVGRSNVGKSSLLNYIAGQKQLARVSATPGRTRLLNLFQVEDPYFSLVDLPGYGFAKVSHEEKASWEGRMGDYFEGRANLKAFLFLFDVRRSPVEEDLALFSWLQAQGLKETLIVTKSEKVHKSKWVGVKKELSTQFKISPDAIVFTSSMAKFGIDGIRNALWASFTNA